jgi:hypothetical protein
MLGGEAENTNFIVFGSNPWISMIYRTQGEHANHYTTNMVTTVSSLILKCTNMSCVEFRYYPSYSIKVYLIKSICGCGVKYPHIPHIPYHEIDYWKWWQKLHVLHDNIDVALTSKINNITLWFD